MAKEIIGEQWKKVKFNVEHTNKFTLEVSNMGRLRTFNKISDGNIIKGSLINGYKIIRLKLFLPRDAKLQAKFDKEQQKVFEYNRAIKKLVANKATKAAIKEATAAANKFQAELSVKFKVDMKKRTVHFQPLVHRLVAEYFLKAPKKGQTIVSHIDHSRTNNIASNLQWMTPEENHAHQAKSPAVIKDKKRRTKERLSKIK